jgi:hypothetical protein
VHAAERRGFYDLHGEEALKSGIPDGKGGKRGGQYSFSPAKCEEIFSSFFGTSNPFEAIEGTDCSLSFTLFVIPTKAWHKAGLSWEVLRPTSCSTQLLCVTAKSTSQMTERCLSRQEDQGPSADIATTLQAVAGSSQEKSGKKLVRTVLVTLEEVLHGCLKKVVFQRRRLTPAGNMETEDRELTIAIDPGLPDGTRFVFEGCVHKCQHIAVQSAPAPGRTCLNFVV